MGQQAVCPAAVFLVDAKLFVHAGPELPGALRVVDRRQEEVKHPQTLIVIETIVLGQVRRLSDLRAQESRLRQLAAVGLPQGRLRRRRVTVHAAGFLQPFLHHGHCILHTAIAGEAGDIPLLPAGGIHQQKKMISHRCFSFALWFLQGTAQQPDFRL